MSTLVTNEIFNQQTGSPILKSSGNIVQMVRVRYDARPTWSSNNSGNGTTITSLNLTVTPKRAANRLIMRWNLYGEINHNNVFLVHRDGSLITTGGEEGYNNNVGNNRWSGITNQTYDQNDSSTGNMITIIYSQIAGSTSARTYAPAIRSSDSGNNTYYQNRTYGSSGQDNYEAGVSFGVLYEVTV